MSAQSSSQPPPSGRSRPRWVIPAALGLTALLSVAAGTHAFSRHGHGRDDWRGPGLMQGEIDPARAADRADRMIRHIAVEIDATPEQQEKLRAIVRDAVKDLLPMRETARTARQRARGLLTQPTIDRTAIEAFRTEQMAAMDSASRRLTQALADAAEVLTPEQRRQLDDRLTEFREHRGFWMPWRR